MIKKLLRSLVALFILIMPILPLARVWAAGPNLIANPSVETANATNTLPVSWSQDRWGTNTTAFTYKTTEGHTGSKSLYVNMSSRTSGDAKWRFANVTVKPSTKYTFSDYYKANVSSELDIEYTDTAGNVSYTWLANPAASATTWKQNSLSFTTPANVKSMNVFHLIAKAGWVQTDDFSLSEAGSVTPTAPTVSVSSPANGATVSGTQTVSASASDIIGVAGVQFKVDGTGLGAEDTTAPYSTSWNTATVADGSHTVTATARNTSGLTSTASSTVTVNNTTPPTDPTNLVNNPSVETPNGFVPLNWNVSSWGTNTPQYNYGAPAHTGTHGVTVNMTGYTSGDAKWYFSDVAVQAGKTYIFSDYYQANVDTEAVAQYTDASGNITYASLGTIAASSSWRQAIFSMTTPSGVSKLTVYHLIAKNGSLTTDDASLTLYTPPAQTDVIPNNSLETVSPTNPNAPLDWQTGKWGNNTAKFEYLNTGHLGSHSAKVTVSNYVDGDAKWLFNPITTLTPGKMYRFSTWYKTNTIPKAVAQYQLTDGTYKYFGMPNPFPSGSTTEWQYYTETLTVPTNAKNVSVFLFVNSNGWVQVDDQSITNYTPVGFNRPLVSLTFDDGFEENNQSVLPMTAQYGYKTTQCYATQFIQENNTNPGLVMQFKNAGHEICSHTVTHPFLTQLTQAQQDQELSQSQQYLQNLIGAPVRDFASPYGDYNQAVNTEIAKYYRSHRTVDEGYNSKDNFNIYRVRVQNMQYNTTLAEYQSWLDQARATNTWLVLVYHKVWTSGIEQFDTYQSDFAQQLQALNNSGITVKTYTGALDEIQTQL